MRMELFSKIFYACAALLCIGMGLALLAIVWLDVYERYMSL
jgi:hypothetical protein